MSPYGITGLQWFKYFIVTCSGITSQPKFTGYSTGNRKITKGNVKQCFFQYVFIAYNQLNKTCVNGSHIFVRNEQAARWQHYLNWSFIWQILETTIMIHISIFQHYESHLLANRIQQHLSKKTASRSDLNTQRLEKNGQHVLDSTLKCIFFH